MHSCGQAGGRASGRRVGDERASGRSAASDSVDDTLNYKLVAKRLQQFVGDSSFQLVETLAEKIAEVVLGEFDVAWVRVKVNKPGAIRGARDVGVVIERGTRPDAG